jgi:hypothetical protein
MITSARTRFVVAGDKREELNDEELWSVLSKEEFNNGNSLNRVGFYKDTKADTVVAILPKAFAKASAREKLKNSSYALDQFYRLIRVFNKIAREGKFRGDFISTNRLKDRINERSDPILDSIEGAFRLRYDYLKHGLYFPRISRKAKNRWDFPVDWQRTLTQYPPMLQGTEVLFKETWHRKRHRDENDPLLRTQVACLKKIFSDLGEKNSLSETDGMSELELQRTMRHAQTYLRGIRSKVFSDRGRHILSCLSAYLGIGRLTSTGKTERDNILRYSSNFENIWEHILRSVLSPHSKPTPLTPGEWHPISGDEEEGIKPKVDFQIENPIADALVDGKDYQIYNGSTKLGSAADHYKQIIYRQLTKPPHPDRFYNVLMFPSIDQEKLFELVGCHRWKDIPNSRVFEVTVDYNTITKHWLGEERYMGEVQKDLEKLLKKIKSFDSSFSDN